VRLLIDTNIFLEVLLNQAKAEEAKALLAAAGEHDCFISDFALHSIGLLLVRQGKPAVLRQFVTDIVLNAGVQVVSLAAADFDQVIDAVLRFQLDFDNAYQYAIAEKQELTIVSFDADFDRTSRGRRAPASVTSS
jgi:hypothetical protein